MAPCQLVCTHHIPGTQSCPWAMCRALMGWALKAPLWGLMGRAPMGQDLGPDRTGPYGPGPYGPPRTCWAPWALMGQALVGPPGPWCAGPGPNGSHWAPMGRALMGPTLSKAPMGQVLMGSALMPPPGL